MEYAASLHSSKGLCVMPLRCGYFALCRLRYAFLRYAFLRYEFQRYPFLLYVCVIPLYVMAICVMPFCVMLLSARDGHSQNRLVAIQL